MLVCVFLEQMFCSWDNEHGLDQQAHVKLEHESPGTLEIR
jgi:hypothetical protein